MRPDFIRCLEIIKEQLGLHLNLAKCVVYGGNYNESFPREISQTMHGLMVLGSPVGTQNYISCKIQEQVTKAATSMMKAMELQDPLSISPARASSKPIRGIETGCNLHELPTDATKADVAENIAIGIPMPPIESGRWTNRRS